MAMASLSILKSPILPALSLSTVVLLQFGSPSGSNEALNYPLLIVALITSALAICRLSLHLAGNLTSAHFTTDHLSTALLAACFATIMLALPQAPIAFDDPNISVDGDGIIVAWASQGGLIAFAIAVLHKLIAAIFTCPHQQCTKAALFTLCVAVGSLYLTSPVTYNPLLYPTYGIYHFILIPFGFVLCVLLITVGVTVPAPDSLQYPYVSVSFKEELAKLTISVGIVILFIGASISVDPLIRNSAMAAGGTTAVKAM